MSTRTAKISSAGPKLEDPQAKCAKFQKQAAAASAAGMIIGVFTYGIGTVAGIAAAAAITKKGQDCIRKVATQNAAIQKKHDDAQVAAAAKLAATDTIGGRPASRAPQNIRLANRATLNSATLRNTLLVVGGLTLTYYIFKK